MLYTPFMDKPLKKSSANFILIIGFFMLLGGVLGVVFSNKKPVEVYAKGSYRYFVKEAPTYLPEATPILSDNPEIVIPSVFEKITLKPGQFFIHASLDPQLESPKIPDRIEIPKIKLVAPVTVASYNTTKVEGETFGQWEAPEQFAAGWHPDSSVLGKVGNIVINGHHNEFGEVFGRLVELREGDLIYVYYKNEKFKFIVANRMILPERWQNSETRLNNARWLAPTDDYRLTLVTCWPKDSNTDRLILVARPVAD
jgi:LPXTG-site transpeptidase (sortase) family protein